jgi:GTP pyrophosphokinase
MNIKDNNRIIVTKYRKLLKSCRNIVDSKDILAVRKAFDMAVENKLEGNILDYRSINRILDISLIVVEEIGLGRTSIICTLLFNVVITSGFSIDKIEELFGENVARIVRGLLRVSDIYANRKIEYSENFRKLLLTFAEDIRVQLIFLAEKLYEIRNIDQISDEDRLVLAKEVDFIYSPFAHRLGLYNIKSELEDRALKITQPRIYEEIESKLEKSKEAREAYIEKFITPLKIALDEDGFKYKIKARTKSVASILHKMQKKQVEFEEVYDIFAIRIIIDSEGKNEKADCWRVYSVVTDKYMPNPRRLRDWISVPKSNGYESLQTTVMGPDKRWAEVQIRTTRMDEIAEKGFAAHWKYKGGKGDNSLEKWLTDLRDILEGTEGDSFDLIDNFKTDLFRKEVYVFTPNGELKQLPAGATVLDFAYSIHTGIGDKCIGGKVNHKNVPLKYVLNNGEHVEILTSNNQRPKSDWLSFIVTSKARNKIRQFLKEEHYKDAEIGKETLERRLKNWKLEFNDEVIRQLMSHYKYKLAADLYCAIASEKHDLSEIKEILTKEEELVEKKEEIDLKAVKIPKVSSDVLVVDQSVDNVDYKFARCCNPVFGDNIIGFVSIGEGIKIHRESCKNAKDLMRRYPYRIVQAKWTNEGESAYQAVLQIIGDDEIGMISNISQVISKDLRVQMRSISIETRDDMFEGKITVLVPNTDNLTMLIGKLKKIKGVIKVNRYDTVEE